jgi:hypothetical protein
MSKTVVITQSNYFPWRGWFEMLAQSDVWVIYDNVQFTKRDWRNRNLIRVDDQPKWLTVPVNTKGKYNQLINETTVSDPEWFRNHRNKLLASYSKFKHIADLEDLITNLDVPLSNASVLSDINRIIIKMILQLFDLEIEIVDAQDFSIAGNSTERLVSLCAEVGGDNYLTGPAARNYLEEDFFNQAKIKIEWMKYDELPLDLEGNYGTGEYSILDLIARVGIANLPNFLPSLNK